MTENPYHSPQATSTDFDAPNEAGAVARPLGVTILAILQFIFGVSLIAGPMITILSRGLGYEELGPLSSLMINVRSTFVLRTSILFPAAVGLWIGKRWGWWLSAFNYAFSILGFIVTQRYSVSIFIVSLMFLYHFQNNVLHYFGLQNLSRIKAMLILFGISLVVGMALG